MNHARELASSYAFNSEKWLVLKPLLFSLVFPLLIGLFRPSLIKPLIYLFFAAAVFLPGFVMVFVIQDWLGNSTPLYRAFLKRIQPFPSGVITGTDLAILSTPWVTLALIGVNTVFFLALPLDVVKRGVFFPLGDWTASSLVVSFFACAFLHSGFFHLFVNMIFLWAFGSALEPRLGGGVFLLTYLAANVASNLLCIFLLSLQAISIGSFENFFTYHSLGASGAISGLMGLFAVRAYFAKIKLAVPFLFIPFLSFPLSIQTGVLVGLFFCMDVSGGLKQFSNTAAGGVDYWAHLGGYLGGIAMGYFLKLHKDAAREAREVNAERLAEKGLLRKDAADIYGEILAQDPDNEKALKFFCRFHRFNGEKRAPYLGRLLHVLEKKNFEEALDLFEENYPNSLKFASGDALLKIGLHYLRVGDFQKGALCLEFSSENEGPWQAKALYSLAGAYEEMDQIALAVGTLKKVLLSHPGTPFSREAQKELSRIETLGFELVTSS